MRRQMLSYAIGSTDGGRRWLVLSLIIAAAYPLLFLAALYGTWLAARFQLGTWPRPVMDDPNHIGGAVIPLSIVTLLLLLGYFPALLASIVEVLWVATLVRFEELRLGGRGWACLLLPLLAWTASIAILCCHGHHVVNWIID